MTIKKLLMDGQLILEGSDLQLIEERGLTGGNFITFRNNLHVGQDFNLGLDDLGSNTEVTEETGLTGIETSGTSGDHDILGSKSTRLGRGFSDLRVENVGDFEKIVVSENERNVGSHLGDDLIKVGT